jgi:hypothetical protein
MDIVICFASIERLSRKIAYNIHGLGADVVDGHQKVGDVAWISHFLGPVIGSLPMPLALLLLASCGGPSRFVPCDQRLSSKEFCSGPLMW